MIKVKRYQVWDCLDAELHNLSVEAELETTGVADILESPALMLLQDVRDGLRPNLGDRNNPLGSIVILCIIDDG